LPFGLVFALVLVFAFVTELGAVATFAGLITAGVAVALQNVIVSIVGYFFLIGKYGIRWETRVQVGRSNGRSCRHRTGAFSPHGVELAVPPILNPRVGL